jgi:molybdate/tungstate transport system permease protein
MESEAAPEVQGRSFVRVSPVSGLTWLLVFVPFVAVFLLIGRYTMAGVIALAAVSSAWLARRWRRRNNDGPLIGFSVFGALLILFIVLPILNLLFTTAPGRIWATASDQTVESALLITVSSAGVATLVSLSFGIPLGYVLARERFAGKAMVEAIVDMPVVIPHTVAGIALLFIFGRAGILGGPLHSAFGILFSDTYWGIVLAMVFVGIPFVVNQSRDGFIKVDPRMENVARSLGASRFEAFLRVTIPLTWRSLLSAAIMTWARGVSEFGSVAVIAYYPRTINTLLFEWYNFFGYVYTKPLAALLLLVALAIFATLRTVAAVTRAEHD